MCRAKKKPGKELCRKYVRVFCVVLFAMGTLSGCDSSLVSENARVEFALWQGNITERNDYKYILTEGEETVVEKNHYIFENGIEEEVKLDFIEKQETLISFMDPSSSNAGETGYTFYLTESYIDRGDSVSHETFTTIDSIGTWKQILSTIFLLDGDNTLYGYAYAKSLDLSESLGWGGDAIQGSATDLDEGIRAMLNKDPGRLHLFLPCFLEPYSNPKQIVCAKILAVQIYDTIDVKSEDAFVAKLEKYGDEHNIEYINTDCSFTYGGKRYPLIMETPYTIEYVPNTFLKDPAYTRLGGALENAWLYNMTEFVRVRNLINENMKHAKDDIAPQLNDKCEVYYFQASTGGWDQSQYKISENRILTYQIHDILHEYVHYLHIPQISRFRGSFDFKWMIEGLAEWYAKEVKCDYVNILRAITKYPRGPMDVDFYLYCERASVQDMIKEGNSVRDLLAGKEWEVYPTGLEMAHYIFENYGKEEMLNFYLCKTYSEKELRDKIEKYIVEFEDFITTVYVPEVWEYFGEDQPSIAE